jgi:hypothetical protein
VGGLGAAIAAGATRQAAGLGCLIGVIGGAVFVLTDPRRRLLSMPTTAPRENPGG